ncbi:hypothetical protein B0H14DRAFT_3567985 [Mycena olivaceomarginata]|nr:hypothetical protein B0H14DRAFT_3567985 [Mycena olivaceomarginata]
MPKCRKKSTRTALRRLQSGEETSERKPLHQVHSCDEQQEQKGDVGIQNFQEGVRTLIIPRALKSKIKPKGLLSYRISERGSKPNGGSPGSANGAPESQRTRHVKRSSKSLESEKTKDPILSAWARSEFRRSPKIDREKQDVFSIAESRVNGRGIDRDDVGTWTKSSKYIGGGGITETSKGVELQIAVGVKAEVGRVKWNEVKQKVVGGAAAGQLTAGSGSGSGSNSNYRSIYTRVRMIHNIEREERSEARSGRGRKEKGGKRKGAISRRATPPPVRTSPPISATTSSSRSVTMDCSARADDVPQQGRRHGIFKYMHEEKSKCHPAHEGHAKEKNIHAPKVEDRGENISSKHEVRAPKPSRPARLSTTHTAPLGRVPTEPPKEKRKKGKPQGRGGCMREKEAEAGYAPEKTTCVHGTSTTEY